MTILQLNPPGMASTDVGYISSITVRYNGANNVLTPDGSNQITLPNGTTGAIDAAARLLGGPGNITGPRGTGIAFVSTNA
jgi:hypothetical protein